MEEAAAAAHYKQPTQVRSLSEMRLAVIVPIQLWLAGSREWGRRRRLAGRRTRMQIGEINIAQAADWHKQLRLAWQLDQVQVMLGSIFHWAVSTAAAPPTASFSFLAMLHSP